MPESERKVIWGMMVGEEAKTKVPIYQNYTERGFDPERHVLQSYGTGWQSASFLEQERQFFGAPGGLMHDSMQNYCGSVKCDSLRLKGLDLLKKYEEEAVPALYAANPHELMRVHEVMDILTVAQLVLHASLARKSSSEPLCFTRSDYPEADPPRDRKHIVIRQESGSAVTRQVPLDFFGDLEEEYEKRNRDYMEKEAAGNGR